MRSSRPPRPPRRSSVDAPAPEPTAVAAPIVWSYKSPREFVRDRCDWLRTHDATFSLRRLCRHADFGSPSYVKMYVDGDRNLKPDSALRLAEALGLNATERAYFGLLVDADQHDDAETRDRLQLEMLRMAVRHGHTAALDAARLDYFSHWFVPVIHAMASLDGFQATPHWIAARVRPRIRSYDAKLALDVLVELGVLAERDGAYSLSEARLAVDPAIQSPLIAEYLRRMLRLAEQAPEFWPREQRVNSALTVTVPDAFYATLLDRIERFREQLYEEIMAAHPQRAAVRGQVVHVGFQAFKLTDVETAADPDAD